jgi:HemY protein
MRITFWFVALFTLAVLTALALAYPLGWVSFFISGYRVDLSANLLILLMILLYGVIYTAHRSISSFMYLPMIARRWRLQQRERVMNENLLNALEQLMTGRFLRSIKSAKQCIDSANALQEIDNSIDTPPKYIPQIKSLAHLIAAESAQSLRDTKTRDFHLQANLSYLLPINNHSGDENLEASLLSAARWALADSDPASALGWLDKLKSGVARRTLALRLRLKADRLANYHLSALETTRLLNKHRAFSEFAAYGLLKSLCLASIDDCRDSNQLVQTWRLFDKAEQTIPEVAIHASNQLIKLGGDLRTALIWINPVWELIRTPTCELREDIRENLVIVLATILKTLGADKHWLAQVEQARALNPRDPYLQYLCALVCMYNGLWGKAQQLMLEASQTLKKTTLKKAAWMSLAELALQREDEASAITYWKKIALTPDF